jgi:hypothetical protein
MDREARSVPLDANGYIYRYLLSGLKFRETRLREAADEVIALLS